MSFWKNVSPRRALADLRKVLGTPHPHRWRFMALAGAVTASIFLTIANEGGKGPPRPPELIYFPSFLPGRTDAEIIAGNEAATKAQKAEEAAQRARDDEARKIYRALGNASGMEADKAYDEGTRERDAAEKALAAKRQALLNQYPVKRVNE